MTAEFKRKRMRASSSLFMKRLARYVLFGIIVALIPFFLLLVMSQNKSDVFTGIVESESETVGSVDSSRILSIEVFPGQKVKPGDILVRLEPSDQAMELAMNEARLMDYEQSLARFKEAQIQYRQSLQESHRKYRQLVEEASVELEQEKMNKARDEAELKGLENELNKLQPLVDNRVISELELAALRPRITTLKLTISHYKPLIKALQRRLDKAQEGMEEVLELQKNLTESDEKSSTEIALQKAREACKKLSEIELSVLRSTRTGIVSRIQHQAGDVVSAGEPIIRITSESPMHIIGMVPQGTRQQINVGDRIAVTRLRGISNNEILTAEVESLDPEVMDLIDPFNPSPRMPMRGRRMRLRIVNDTHNLVPGETVNLHTSQQETLLDSIKRCFISGSNMKQQLLFTTSR